MNRHLSALFVAVLTLVLLAGSVTSSSALQRQTYQRSVKLNNYGDWHCWVEGSYDQSIALPIAARRDQIQCSEHWCDISAYDIKALNPRAKVYRLYNLCCKNDWDTDWSKTTDKEYMQFPFTKDEIDANDWWLRDSNGNILQLDSESYYVDVGKPGFKEAYLKALLDRNDSLGFDGVVFDIWWPWLPDMPGGCPSYPSDDVYFRTAWQPFILYLINGLHAKGYRVIGNERQPVYDNTYVKWEHDVLDGAVYERWSVGWSGEWVAGSEIDQRIKAFSTDTKECWAADGGLDISVPQYDQKQVASLAMYYIAIPKDQSKRSYQNRRNALVYWEPLWDFYIGVPAESYKKLSGAYFWSRKFTNGLVILNYQPTQSKPYRLTRTYVDYKGKLWRGTITIPPYTGLILANR